MTVSNHLIDYQLSQLQKLHPSICSVLSFLYRPILSRFMFLDFLSMKERGQGLSVSAFDYI